MLTMNIYEKNFKEFTEYVKNIRYGYIDNKGTIHLNVFMNPTDNYFLQSPVELEKSNVGLCFDIVEMYRSFLESKSVICESYYIEYHDGDILECHAFIIEQRKNKLWYECVDNSWANDFYARGYFDKDLLIKSIYEWFQNYISEEYKIVDKSNFYLNKYDYPKEVLEHKMSLRDFCYNRDYLDTHRVEYSGMSIVFCQNKVLVLETKHNEYVFPKGHIESGEDSKDASIRECFEESGIQISDAKYYGECGNYSYTFTPGHLKITNDDYYKTFKVNSITKNIYVHVYEIKNFQQFKLENIFIKGIWTDINDINQTISHENTKLIFKEALRLYNENHKND